MIIRSHAAMGGGKLFLINPLGNALNENKLKKTARSMNQLIDTYILSDFEELRLYSISNDVPLIAIEIAETAIPLSQFSFPNELIFLLGNEMHGIPAQILKHCQSQLIIPQNGRIGSLNLAVSASIAMYEYSRNRINACPIIGNRFDINLA